MLQWGGCTDLGRTRPINEDGYYISEYSQKMDALYAIVADGMGGHQAGEVVSAMAIRQISETINQGVCNGMTPSEIKELLVSAIKQANRAIYETSKKERDYGGMGTTLTLCFVCGEQAVVAHVGDSRAYMIRNGVMHQITTDHSLVQELMHSGQITAEEAARHPQKNVITRALGTDPGVEIDLYEFRIMPDDVLLLCTDGLTNMLSDEEIASLLAEEQGGTMAYLAGRLVESANQQGGHDNITAVLLLKESGLC